LKSPWGKLKHFVRVHDIQGIEGALDGGHSLDPGRPKLLGDESSFPHPNAMFPSAGSLRFQRPLDHLLVQAVLLFNLFWVLVIQDDKGMKVSVADVTDKGCSEKRGLVPSIQAEGT